MWEIMTFHIFPLTLLQLLAIFETLSPLFFSALSSIHTIFLGRILQYDVDNGSSLLPLHRSSKQRLTLCHVSLSLLCNRFAQSWLFQMVGDNGLPQLPLLFRVILHVLMCSRNFICFSLTVSIRETFYFLKNFFVAYLFYDNHSNALWLEFQVKQSKKQCNRILSQFLSKSHQVNVFLLFILKYDIFICNTDDVLYMINNLF